MGFSNCESIFAETNDCTNDLCDTQQIDGQIKKYEIRGQMEEIML